MVASGKTHTEEARTKISAAHIGMKHSEETKAKISAANTGRIVTEETRAKISAANTGKTRTEEFKVELSARMTGENNPTKRPEVRAKFIGENNPMYGKTPSETTKAKQKAWWTLEKRAEASSAKMGKNNPNFGKTFTHTEKSKSKIRAAWTPEKRAAKSAIMRGENNLFWNGGISFEPYCPRFNSQLKEQIRNRDNRTCVLCGKGEIQNGRRLCVHHIDGDKMQGCNGKRWYLCSLCISCNSKKDTVEKEFLIVTTKGRH